MSLFLYCLIFLFTTAVVRITSSIPAISAAMQRNNGIKVDEFVSLRSGNEGGTVVWYHQGLLRNPFNGAEVAGIEGVEITRKLPNTGIDEDSSSNRIRMRNWRSDDSEITKLYGFNNTYCGRYVTSKMFVYVDPQQRSEILKEFRIRPGSPAKKVKAAKRMTELVCIGVDHDTGRQFAHIEWPGGRKIWAHRLNIVSNVAPLDRLFGSMQYDITAFIAPVKKKHTRKWISFAPDTRSSGGSQEYYSIRRSSLLPTLLESIPALFRTRESAEHLVGSMPAAKKQRSVITGMSGNFRSNLLQRLPPRVIMNYKRYGESPPWYAVGRSCVIEMHSERYPSTEYLPSSAQRLFHELDPKFFDKSFAESPNLMHKLLSAIPRRTKQSGEGLKEKWLSKGYDMMDSYPSWYSKLNPFRKSKRNRKKH